MHWKGWVAPLALASTACSSWFRAGPQVRAVDGRAAVEGKGVVAGGIEKTTFPLSLTGGAYTDDGESIMELGTGMDYTSLGDETGWGYVAGPRLGVLVSGPSGTSFSMNGGPVVLLPGTLGNTLSLELSAGVGLGGDIAEGFVGGATLCFGSYHEGVFTIPHGRVLSFEGRPCLASVLSGAVRRPLREDPELGLEWLRAGLEEHSSIAAFVRLAFELVELGAPRALVTRSLRAANDEVRHAASCFGLASAHLGRELWPGALPVPARAREADLVTLAVEALTDGCFGEGVAARLAQLRAHSSEDPVARAVHREIARDEARHAELAWSTLRWCLSAGGDRVRHALPDAVHSIVGLGASDELAYRAQRGVEADLVRRLHQLGI
jgi:hypothetical protein